MRDKDPHEELLSNHPSGGKRISNNLVRRLLRGLIYCQAMVSNMDF